MEEWIKPEMRIFEYGSGWSTLWLGQRASEVVTVENDEPYFHTIEARLEEYGIHNVEYIHREGGKAYSKAIHEYEGMFDLVFVDGRFRKECMEECYDKARYAIFLDNTDAHHYFDAYDVMKSYKNGTLRDFYSRGFNPDTQQENVRPESPGTPMVWKASVFLKQVQQDG